MPVKFELLIWIMCIIHLIKLLKITPTFTLQIKLHIVVLRIDRERVGKAGHVLQSSPLACVQNCVFLSFLTHFMTLDVEVGRLRNTGICDMFG